MRSLERSARFWLRAYPPAWRAERADEVTAVLLDLADDGARRLDLRTVLGLLRGGIATRWRQTPPLRVYLPYRVLNVRVPVQYREWAYRDISSPGHLRRDLLGLAWLFVLPVYTTVIAEDRAQNLVMWTALAVAAVATGLCMRPGARVRRLLQHHVRPGRGEPRTLGEQVWVRTSRERVAARPAARVLLLLLAAGAATWSVATVVAPSRVGIDPCVAPGALGCFEFVTERRAPSPVLGAVLLGALGCGFVVAVVVARRLRRRLPTRPDQPRRHLVGLPPRTHVGVALWVGLVAAAATAEATGAWVHSLSFIAAPVCLVLLPPAVVLWLQARATPDSAFVDLWRVARTGRPVPVDRYDTHLVPALES